MRLFFVALMLLAGARPMRCEESIDFQAVVVKPGDTLWGISHKYLKDPARWDEILKYNKLPSSDPTVALPGLVLKVPMKLIKEDLRAAKLIYRHNKVMFRRKETAEWMSAADNMQLFRNDALRTLEDSKARVKFINEDLLQLDSNAMAVIKPTNKDYDVELKAGGIFVGKARVVTASAKITPKTQDTKYAATVKNDMSTIVEVYKGKAAVESQGKSVDVTEGMVTDVKMGLPPSLPVKIPDKADFDLRGAEFDGDQRVARAKIANPTLPTPDLKNLGANAVEVNNVPEVDQIKTQVDALRVGVPISGYRVQFSVSEDFTKTAYDNVYDADQPVRPAQLRISDGRYWVRIALVDLLGASGRFSQAKLYLLAGGALTPITASARASRGLASKLTLLRPLSDEVVFTEAYEVQGRVKGELGVMVNGKSARKDEGGNFSVTIRLGPGDNPIRISLLDAEGNTEMVMRTVTLKKQ